MKMHRAARTQPEHATAALKALVHGLGVDLFGIADLACLPGMPTGLTPNAATLVERYRYAIVLGAPLNQLGKKAASIDVNLFLERAALGVLEYLEEKRVPALIIHPEDEFDPIGRKGLLSLKVLAKAAGLGWQGRSLLIVSPDHGPIHRLIAVLTDLDVRPSQPIPNQCGDCGLCIDKCPAGALRKTVFHDHPERREDVLDIGICRGDDGCKVCLVSCPWATPDPDDQAGSRMP